MRNRPASVAVCTGLVVVGLVGGIEMRARGQGAPAAQEAAPIAPMDTGVLRAQYEQWRTQFKTWGKWAPIGQESKGTTNLIHAGEGRERVEACERWDRGVARARRAADRRRRRRRRRHLPPR